VEFADQARETLMPLLLKVLDLSGGPLVSFDAADLVGAGDDLPVRAFFTGMLLQARAMRQEEDVLALFFELSTTAFQGFVYPDEVAEAIDELLAAAELISFTMTASDQLRH
jgi:hypothetical protein